MVTSELPVQFLHPSENVDISNVECLMEDICRHGAFLLAAALL
ncbi:hypothetical protein Pecwa_4076 [Pectobacterium parmentieri WPP163]|nr:hypothetical protein Pecwa_4076 [Pectobacterium parmentieri WPP163]POW26257.1 hypothetical protein PB20LOC_02835 [Pectobacterium parmentieri]